MSDIATLRKRIASLEGWQTRRRAALAAERACYRRLRRPDRRAESKATQRTIERAIRDGERKLKAIRKALAEARRAEAEAEVSRETTTTVPELPPPPAPEPPPEPPAPVPAWIQALDAAGIRHHAGATWVAVALDLEPSDPTETGLTSLSVLLDTLGYGVGGTPLIPDGSAARIAYYIKKDTSRESVGVGDPDAYERAEGAHAPLVPVTLPPLSRVTRTGWHKVLRKVISTFDVVTDRLLFADWSIRHVEIEICWSDPRPTHKEPLPR